MRLEIIDTITDPSRPDAENEDRIGWNDSAAFVIDGATNLGPSLMAPSDAAWVAELARRHFEAALRPDRSLRDVVRGLCQDARDRFRAVTGASIERYRHPGAGFESLRLTDSGLEIAGLGDCTLFLRDAGGVLTRYSGIRGGRSGEQSSARSAIARLGGFSPDGEAYRNAEALDGLRASRARANTEGGVWILGIHPEAADHVRIETPEASLPATGLLCTDGFADAVDNYGLCTAPALIERAVREGLRPLLAEIRRVEREIDPGGLQFPRFKRSDDASAILLGVSES